MLVEESELSSQLGMEDTQPNLHMDCQGTGATMLNGLPEQLSADSVPTSAESHVAGCGDTSITSELSSRATTQTPTHLVTLVNAGDAVGRSKTTNE